MLRKWVAVARVCGVRESLGSLYTRKGWVVVGWAGLVGHLAQYDFVVPFFAVR
jgi:hypothetical protein